MEPEPVVSEGAGHRLPGQRGGPKAVHIGDEGVAAVSRLQGSHRFGSIGLDFRLRERRSVGYFHQEDHRGRRERCQCGEHIPYLVVAGLGHAWVPLVGEIEYADDGQDGILPGRCLHLEIYRNS